MAQQFYSPLQLNSTLTVGVDDTGHDVKFFGATSGRYMLWDESQDRLEFTDDVKAVFGTNADLVIYHDGSNSYITQQDGKSGNLIISQNTDDADIIFKSDDGSGGVAEYFRVDGSLAEIIFSRGTRHMDSKKATFGSGQDLQIYHDGSHSYMDNGTGNLYIRNLADDADVIFRTDDGAGDNAEYLKLKGSTRTIEVSAPTNFGVDDTGHDVFFYGATSGKYLKWDESADCLFFPDDTSVKFGNGNDARIYISSDNLHIQQDTADTDIKFLADNGSGQATVYLTLDGSHTETVFSQNARFADNAVAKFGVSSDLQIYHNASNSYIYQVGTGNLHIATATDDGDIIFSSDDGSGGVAEYFRVDGGSSQIEVSKSMRFADGIRARFGAAADIDIYHDGSNSYIKNATGDLYIQQNADDKDIVFQSDDGSGGTTAYLTLDGSVSKVQFDKPALFVDNKSAEFGTDTDMIMYSSGSHGYIENYTGDLKFINNADDKDIIFQSDDGSGGVETYFFLDGSANGASPLTVFPDSSQLAFGSGPDAYVYHNGSDFYLDNYTGDFYITAQGDDKDLILRSDDGSGGVTPYITLDGSTTTVEIAKNTTFAGSVGVGGSPGAKFDVNAGATNTVAIFESTDDKAFIILKDDTTSTHLITKDNKFSIGESSTDYDNFKVDISTGDATFAGDITVGDDLFMPSGGVISFDSGDVTITHSSNVLFIEDGHLRMADSKRFYAGSSGDLEIYHDGTNNHIATDNGDLNFTVSENDHGIYFNTDDGSGGVTEYFRVDGQYEVNRFLKNARFNDNVKANFGTSDDLQIYHNSSNDRGYIYNATGDLYIENDATDGDIKFFSDNMSGGTTEYFRLDGGLGESVFSRNTQLLDSVHAQFGTGNDLKILHDSNHSYIKNYTGDLYIENFADDKDIIFKSDDGSGGVAEYLRLDGSSTKIFISKNMHHDDNVQATFGASNDLQIYHDGTDSYVSNTQNSGDLIIENGGNDKDVVFKCDDGSGGLETYFFLDGSTGQTRFPDNKLLSLGTGGDLDIYHDGSNSFIQNTTGNLTIRNDVDDGDIIFRCDDGSGGVETYFFLDGSSGGGAPFTVFPDSSYAVFGAGHDLRIYHDGSDSYINNMTGDLYIVNGADDKDIIFRSDDGSGGVATYLTLDGSGLYSEFGTRVYIPEYIAHSGDADSLFGFSGDDTFIINTAGSTRIKVASDGNVAIGTNNPTSLSSNTTSLSIDSTRTDLSGAVFFKANGTVQSQIYWGTSGLILENTADDADIIFKSDDQSGGTATYFYLDGSVGFNRFPYPVIVEDSVNFNLGTGQDMQLLHNGSDSVIRNATGDLYIQQNADDKDIIFQSDDGSGGTASYFRLDGSEVETRFHKATLHLDNVKAKYGDSGDLQIFHDGTNTFIESSTGNFDITQLLNNGDMRFRCDNGAGGEATYFSLDGSAASHNGSATTALYTNWPDNSIVSLGDGHDLQISHSGSNSQITNLVGDLIIEQNTDDGDIIFKSDDGSGGLNTYLTIDGGADRTIFSRSSRHNDGVVATFGASEDLQIYHDGNHSYIKDTGTGFLFIEADAALVLQNSAGESYLTATSNGSVSIRHDNAVKLETTSTGVAVTGDVTVSDDIFVADSGIINLGTGNDLQIYHSGSNSHITDAGTGSLFIEGSNHIYFRSADQGEYYAQFNDDGACKFYHNNVVKLETTSAGITVAGNIVLSDDGTIGSASDTDAISIDDSGVVTFSSRIIANVREFEVASGTDGDGKGDVVYFGSTTSMTAGKIYHYKSDGTWELADASAVATCDGLLAVALGTASNTHGMLLRGMVTIANDPGAVGDVLYVSETGGQATATAPSASNAIVRVIGYCVHATNGNIWFNPDGTFVEVA